MQFNVYKSFHHIMYSHNFFEGEGGGGAEKNNFVVHVSCNTMVVAMDEFCQFISLVKS